MQTVNISIPDDLKRFVDGQVSQGHYSSASEYLNALIQADERRKAEALLEAKLVEGLSSPEHVLDDQEWADIRQDAMSELAQRR